MSKTYSEKYKKYIDTGVVSNSTAEQTFYRFENGYGASVIYGPYTYDLEVAVIWFIPDTEGDWKITYDTPVTDDVVGYVEDLDSVLKEIKELES